MSKRYLEAGKIVNTHGIKGDIKILPWADNAEFLTGFKRLYITEKEYEITSIKIHKTSLLVHFKDINNVNDAMLLKGKTVFIDRNDVILPDGDFFIQDIIGSNVTDQSGQIIGTLTNVLEYPSSNVYVITGEREFLIPAVPAFILSTDVKAKKITVRLIEGM